MSGPSLPPPSIVRAEGDLLFDAAGRSYIDLFSANGTAWLGHCPPDVVRALQAQLEVVWTTGALDTPMRGAASQALAAWWPAPYQVAGWYSTGMEAAEFALRLARVATGRPGALGFVGAMHGKSLGTSSLGWDNPGQPAVPGYGRLPFVDRAEEAEILSLLAARLEPGDVGALCVEPILASQGAYRASAPFYRQVAELCRRHGALLIWDELLTGFYRSGERFFADEVGVAPDVVLLGKALGSGFPVAAAVVDRRWQVTPTMLPGSTFAGNSLAAVAASATLAALAALDLRALVEGIAATLAPALAPLAEVGVTVRGQGALWALELPARRTPQHAAERIFRRGVAVGYAGPYLRLLPAATIDRQRLARGAAIVVEEILAGP